LVAVAYTIAGLIKATFFSNEDVGFIADWLVAVTYAILVLIKAAAFANHYIWCVAYGRKLDAPKNY
jgi:hypothetical protein